MEEVEDVHALPDFLSFAHRSKWTGLTSSRLASALGVSGQWAIKRGSLLIAFTAGDAIALVFFPRFD